MESTPMTSKPLRNPKKSVHTDTPRSDNALSLVQLRIDGRADAEQITMYEKAIKRDRKASLMLWFAQAKRCLIAVENHGMKGAAFVKFAAEIGVDRSTAYELVKLAPRCAELAAQFEKDEAEGQEWPTLPNVLQMVRLETALAEPKTGGKAVTTKLSVVELHQELEATREKLKDELGARTELTQRLRALESKKRIGYGIFGQGDQERATPMHIFNHYDRQFHFVLDVAATAENAKCKEFFTKHQDGLRQRWHGNVWMNPPYNNIGPWCTKAWEYAATGEGTVVALLPIWTGTAWYQKCAIHGHVRLLTRRITFVGSKSSAPFDCMIVVWTKTSQCENGRLFVTMEDLPPDPTKTARRRVTAIGQSRSRSAQHSRRKRSGVSSAVRKVGKSILRLPDRA
jgi:phage N-6-adenine-methyltransferase